jgi:VIT1/CCC1 family predicted Fe2+/Mn2+ transporter
LAIQAERELKKMETISYLMGALIYFLPTIIAVKRETFSCSIIILLNLLLGWTGIVWIALFLWAIFESNKKV